MKLNFEKSILRNKICELEDNLFSIEQCIHDIDSKINLDLNFDETFYPTESSLIFLQSPQNAIKYLEELGKYNERHSTKIRTSAELESYLERKSSKKNCEQLSLLNMSELTEIEKYKLATNLSFKIKRFSDFMDAYETVNEDIKPIMLYYATNYLFTFLSETILRFDNPNKGHGIRFHQQNPFNKGGKFQGPFRIDIAKNQSFSRIVNAFYALKNSSIFSLDDYKGITYKWNNEFWDSPLDPELKKLDEICENSMNYSKGPTFTIQELAEIREEFYGIKLRIKRNYGGMVNTSNLILIDYLMLFSACSAARYSPEEWNKVLSGFDNKYEFLHYHFKSAQANMINEWLPLVISEYIFPAKIANNLPISSV